MSVSDLREIAVNEVYKGERRPINMEVVDQLALSIDSMGLMNPITVRDYDGDGPFYWELVAGAHRLAAHEKLGKDTIRAQVIEADDDDARLWEIEENLLRSDLTKLERDLLIAEREQIIARNNAKAPEPEKKRKPGRPAGAKNKPKNNSGVSPQVVVKPSNKNTGGRPTGNRTQVAATLGITKIAVERANEVAKLVPEARKAAVELGLDDNQRALLSAAKHSGASAQVEELRRKAKEKKEQTPRTNLDKAKEAYRKLSTEEREQFYSWLSAEEASIMQIM